MLSNRVHPPPARPDGELLLIGPCLASYTSAQLLTRWNVRIRTAPARLMSQPRIGPAVLRSPLTPLSLGTDPPS